MRGNAVGWTSPEIVASIAGGAVAARPLFVAWELRAPRADAAAALLPQPRLRAANAASLLMFFGMFGSIFLLAQFFQIVQGYSPLQAGLRILPWTAMPIFVAPIAGALSDRIGGRTMMAAGLACRRSASRWIATVSTPTVAYGELVVPFILSGVGMALYFAPVANVVLSSCGPKRRARPRARTTPSASSAASSASPSWPGLRALRRLQHA